MNCSEIAEVPMPKPWKALRRQIHHHSPHYRIEDVHFELPSGEQTTYALTHGPKTVAVLALTPDLQVVLARQYRPGPDRVLDELPGGSIDEEEESEDAALRELREETGYVPERIVRLGHYFEGAYSTTDCAGFLALGCERKAEQRLDPREFIRVVLKSLPDFVAQLRQGESTDCHVAWAGLFEGGFLSCTS